MIFQFHHIENILLFVISQYVDVLEAPLENNVAITLEDPYPQGHKIVLHSFH